MSHCRNFQNVKHFLANTMPNQVVQNMASPVTRVLVVLVAVPNLAKAPRVANLLNNPRMLMRIVNLFILLPMTMSSLSSVNSSPPLYLPLLTGEFRVP